MSSSVTIPLHFYFEGRRKKVERTKKEEGRRKNKEDVEG